MIVSHYELMNNPNDTTAVIQSLELEKNNKMKNGVGGSWCGKGTKLLLLLLLSSSSSNFSLLSFGWEIFTYSGM